MCVGCHCNSQLLTNFSYLSKLSLQCAHPVIVTRSFLKTRCSVFVCVQVRASGMLACCNKDCTRRFCEHCLSKSIGDDVNPQTSNAWERCLRQSQNLCIARSLVSFVHPLFVLVPLFLAQHAMIGHKLLSNLIYERHTLSDSIISERHA